jgi:primosomal protein N' (replication factor Y)
MYAEIVVNTPLGRKVTRGGIAPDDLEAGYSPLGMTFHYSLPPSLAATAAPGQLVWVPFGPRRLQGVILALSETSPVAETRDIYEIVDPVPVLTPAQIDLARWISDYYLASLHECVWLMLPPGVGQEVESMLQLRAGVELPANLTPTQRTIVELLRREGKVPTHRLSRTMRLKEWRPALEQLIRKGIVVRTSELAEPRAKPKTERVVRLANVEALPASLLDRAPKQRAVVEYLRGKAATSVSEVYAATGADAATLNALAEKELVVFAEEEVWRDPLAGRSFVLTAPPKLTPDQEAAWREIELGINEHAHRVYLLHGVTGSGKTELYLQAIDAVLAQGRQAIVLVPEIALTPQTVRRFAARFPGRLTVTHSQLSPGERYDQWRRARLGLVDIVIGSRSAIFAPLPRLGLIVVDEEHEWSYKQDKSPRYHARDVALKLGELTGSTVILGSATPDMTTYYRAQCGEFVLLRLPQRIMGHRHVIEAERDQYAISSRLLAVREVGPGYDDARYLDLPPVQVIDLREELKSGNRSIFSRALHDAMTVALAAGEQVILFLNRRGASTFVMCRDCGTALKCPRCQIPLTYHLGPGGSAAPRMEGDLVCHHCNYRTFAPDMCPSCWSPRIKYFGIGTQKVEEVTRQRFPGVRTLRWDRDVTMRKGSHERILDAFVSHQADVLIGTQMIAKGLDLPLVTLVGVVSADTALNLPDFRAGERTFQILTQVAGRAGRSILGGKVVIQTYNPEHYAIQAASHHDYAAFYEREIEFRREQGYPPFGQLIRLLYLNPSDERCREESERLHRLLVNRLARLGLPNLDLIGPAPAFLGRIRRQSRWQIVLRGRNPRALLEGIALPLGWRVDVDPMSLL